MLSIIFQDLHRLHFNGLCKWSGLTNYPHFSARNQIYKNKWHRFFIPGFCLPSNRVKTLKELVLVSTLITGGTESIHLHTHTHPFNGPLSGTTRVSHYHKDKTSLHFTEARDSEWQWHQLGYMQVCTSLQTDNHASTPLLSILQAGCPSCRPTNSVRALKAIRTRQVQTRTFEWNHFGPDILHSGLPGSSLSYLKVKVGSQS